jgi:hypothetical protein
MATSKKSNNILERSLINNKKVYENQLVLEKPVLDKDTWKRIYLEEYTLICLNEENNKIIK